MNPCIVLAHELFDALPIHQFEFDERRRWRERLITFNKEKNQLQFGVSDYISDFE